MKEDLKPQEAAGQQLEVLSDRYTKPAGWVEKLKQNDLNYKTRLNLQTKYKVFEDFKNGKQWPKATKETADFPRPVFNMVKYIEDHKVNSVKNSTIKVVYSNNEGDYNDEEKGISYQDADIVNDLANKYTYFAASEWERLKLDKINTRVLHTSCNKGLGVVHFPWDAKATGGRKLKWIGAVGVEVLNPLNVAFGNPNCLDVEPQPYIAIYSREMVSEIKKAALESGVAPELIAQIMADKDTKDRVFDNAQVEIDDTDGEGKANVITVYFKVTLPVKKVDKVTNQEYTEKKNFVFFQKYASGMIIQKAVNTEMTRYPIAIMPWGEVEECIYGQAEPEGMINNQRILNLIIACMTKSVENTGFPKLKYKKGSVNPATLNGNIGGMIEITGQAANMNDVEFMAPGQVTALSQNLVEIYMEYTKTLSGATETATGSLDQADAMNASAIALLQKASSIPIDGIRDRYYQFLEDEALILMEYFRTKYNTTRLVSYKDDMNQEQTMLFRGTDAADIDFTPKIDVGPATNYSEMVVIQTLQEFVAAGYLTFDQLLKYAPKNYIPYKEQLIKEREQQAMEMQAEEDQMNLSSLNPMEKAAFESADDESKQEMLRKMRITKKAMMQEQGTNPQMPMKA